MNAIMKMEQVLGIIYNKCFEVHSMFRTQFNKVYFFVRQMSSKRISENQFIGKTEIYGNKLDTICEE